MFQLLVCENDVGFHQKKCPQLSDLVSGMDFHDVFRALYPNKREFTFFRPNSAPSRLDKFYFPKQLIEKVTSVEHLASLSDHFGVHVSLHLDLEDFCKNKRSKIRHSYWKLNSAILHDEDFLPSFSNLWVWLQSLKSDFGDIAEWWDTVVKPYIKEFCIHYSRSRNNQRKCAKIVFNPM